MKNTYTLNDYIQKCEELGLIYVGNHKEHKRGTMIEFICKKHKEKGIQSKDWSHFRTYKYGCTYCSGRGQTTKDIEEKINGRSIRLLSEYIGNEKPIDCMCEICGNTWTTLPKTLVTNKSGCPVCGRKKANASTTKTKEQFVKELKEINDSIIVVGDYTNTHTKIKCKCNYCGNVWDAYPANLLNRSAGCSRCNISLGEKEMLDALDDLNIPYIPQYMINDGKHIRPLRFDAYSQELNTAFEYNGEQHYRPVDFSGSGEEWSNNEFEKTKERDQSKYEYCTSNNIKIIIVPYWEKNNVKNYITKLLGSEIYK